MGSIFIIILTLVALIKVFILTTNFIFNIINLEDALWTNKFTYLCIIATLILFFVMIKLVEITANWAYSLGKTFKLHKEQKHIDEEIEWLSFKQK